MKHPIPRILFVTANRVGDAVLSTGLLAHLIETRPEARFTVAVGPIAAPLFRAAPRVERLIAIRKGRYGRHWLSLWGQSFGTHWDLALDLRGSALPWLLRAAARRGVAKGDPDVHRVVQLARALGLDPPPSPRIWLDTAAVAAAERRIPPGSPVLALAPAANWRGKQWPVERFADLALRLTGAGGALAGARVAVLAAGHERAQVAPLLAALRPESRLDLVGAGDLALVAALLARADFFIGNDSGLMHMAAALDVPTLGLFGPSLDSHYAPWGSMTAVARTPESHAELTGTPDFDHRTTGTLMGGLTVETVEAAAGRLAERVRTRAAS